MTKMSERERKKEYILYVLVVILVIFPKAARQ